MLYVSALALMVLKMCGSGDLNKSCAECFSTSPDGVENVWKWRFEQELCFVFQHICVPDRDHRLQRPCGGVPLHQL